MPLPSIVPAAFDICDDLRGRDFLSISDVEASELRGLLDLASVIKAAPKHYDEVLAGRTLAMIFEKPSLRTRVSFDIAMHQLGGHAITLTARDVGFGERESIADVARTLEGMVDGIVARTFAHATLERLAAATRLPVVNGLSDRTHPCQALADFLTIRELLGRLAGVRLAYVGDANNVADALIAGAALLGVRLTLAVPPGYGPRPEALAWARARAAEPDVACRVVAEPLDAVRGADVVYTDTWVSMGQEAEAAARLRTFAPFAVTSDLLDAAAPGAVFMHCLPAHRGVEVADDVIDSPRSVVFQQAANRLHTEKALLCALVG